MYLTRLVSLLDLEDMRVPSILVISMVNEMRKHFSPVEDLTTLRISFFPMEKMLKFTMELP